MAMSMERLARPQLKFLGAATIQGASGVATPLSARRHPVALLALLASTPARAMARGKIAGLLWPDSSEQTARNRLNTAVHQVRSALGADALDSTGDELRLGPAVDCDVCSFEAALAGGDLAAAVAQHGGTFLDGFHLGGSVEFQNWIDAERERIAQAWRDALEALAEAATEAGAADEAVQWWRRRAAADRGDSRVVRRLMEVLDTNGNRAEALRLAQAHERFLEQEYGTGQDPQVLALVERLLQSSPPAAAGGGAPGQAAAPPASAIAVLPFANLSGSPETDPFAAGLHDDLLTELSRIEGLSVIARTSVLVYRDSRQPVQQIARELGVGTLVEGAVQSSGGRLRVNVQLVDAASGQHAWAERYDRALTTDNLFDIQSDLVERIAGSLRAELVPDAGPRGTLQVARPTRDLEAYRLNAQGHQQLVQLTDASLQRAVDYFRAAIERDADYALAWVGLGDALTARLDYAYDACGEVMPEAEAAVRHALSLQPDLAEAHAGLGKLYSIQRKGPAAIASLTRAVELMPACGQAHDWLSWTWQNLGQPGPALESARRAVEFEPLLREAVSNLAISHLANGLREQALLESRRIRELAPGWTSGAFYEGLTLYNLGRYDEARSVLQGLVVEWVGPGPQATLALACIGSGEHGRARDLQATLAANDDHFSVGLVHAALDDVTAAFDAFEKVGDWGAYWPTLAMHQYFPGVVAGLGDSARLRGVFANIHRAWGLEADGSFPG